ncbi:MAG: hypothetical protein WCR72_16195 [Bacteroidota bacterium]
MKSIFKISLLIIVLLPLQSRAGWLITGRYIDREGNTIMKRYFIQDNEVKVEKYNLIYSCNLKTGNIILVDPVKLVYVKTTFTAYYEKMKAIKLRRLNELLALIPEEQKKEYESMYTAQVEQQLILPVLTYDSLIISQLPDSVKLLGRKTKKFVISDNGLKKEEFFYTNEVNIAPDMDFSTFMRFVYLLEPEDKTIKYQASGKYKELMKNGYVLRRFIFEEGYKSEWQVNNIEQKNIPAYEFMTPALCKELTLDKWLSSRKEVDDNYYDDYE